MKFPRAMANYCYPTLVDKNVKSWTTAFFMLITFSFKRSCPGKGSQNPLACAPMGSVVKLLPPANEVWGKVIFSEACVILSTGGVGVRAWPGTTPPPRSRHPQGLHTPQTTYPRDCIPPRDYVPPQTTYPQDYIPPQTMYPLDYVPPLGLCMPPGTMYAPRLHTPGDYVPPGTTSPPWTVYVRVVRILLECILVSWFFFW